MGIPRHLSERCPGVDLISKWLGMRVFDGQRKVVGVGYDICCEMDDGILMVRVSGQVTTDNADSIIGDIFTLCQQHEARKMLADLRELQGRLSIVETYQRVKNYPDYARFIQTAIVDLPENEAFYTFHETTASNRAMHARSFTSLQDAIAWLKG